MPPTPTWEVDLAVYGPIRVAKPIRMSQAKSLNPLNPFYSDIEIVSTPFGVRASVTARTTSSDLARDAALYFFGQMLDALALEIDTALYLSLHESRGAPEFDRSVRRIITSAEWNDAFHEARHLALSEPTFLRALGYYRKGLYTEDAFDRFLAFWTSIEIVGGKYHVPNERTGQGIKNQIWECFIRLWGECDGWPYISGQNRWIDSCYDKRVGIAHGVASIDVEAVREVVNWMPELKNVSYGLLKGWRSEKLEVPILNATLPIT